MKTNFFFIAVVFATFILSSCSEHPGYKQTDGGLFYKFHVQNEDAAKPELGDVMTVRMSYSIEETDSIVFTSDSLSEPSRLQLMEPTYKGDISEGLALMAVGDSASFIVCADSFYINNVGLEKEQIPEYIKPGSNLKFEIKIISIQKKAEYDAEKKLKLEKFQAMMEERKAKEPEDINKFLKDSSITVSPTATGLYYIETKRGIGAKPVKGDSVSVNYTGKYLEGYVFASSVGSDPIDVVLGNNEMIPGWEEGILLMRAGGKATFIIPSDLAYGSKGAGTLILPYTPLVFDVELVKIK
ncbi:MAG: FKBP-type peptidyl-prolyl cis-trans isomerase [Bacteroidota bacterium]